jgi:YidC/Oxa1 family membrane protein insertase
MDKNSILGILLIMAIMVVWAIVQTPNKKELEARQRYADSLAQVQQHETQIKSKEAASFKEDTAHTGTLTNDTTASKKFQNELGEFAVCAQGKEKFYTIENDLIKMVISSKGGRPYSVELKKYSTFTRKPIVLFNGDSTQFGLTFFNQEKPITTNNLYFRPADSLKHLALDKKDSLTMRLAVSDTKYIEYCYVVQPGSYMINMTMKLVGMKDIVTRDPSSLDMSWEIYVPQHEQVKKNENMYTSLYFRHYKEDVDFFRARQSKSVQQQEIPTQVEWVAFKNQFFSSVLIADSGAFSNALLKSTTLTAEDKYLKNFRAELGLPFKRLDNESIHLKMYFGPNKFKLLKQYKEYKLQDLVTVGRGIIRAINKFVIIPMFDWLSKFIGNYGIIILLLTIIIKICLLPLTYKSYLSQARMKVLKPQIDELSQKYPKGKEVEKQQATMALYKKAGISPMGGCLPMLLQMPILFAMFRFFPTSIELRQQGFLWAKDLSTFDSIISWQAQIPVISSLFGNHISLFNLLMTASTLIQIKMSDTSGASQQMPGMKAMMYVMPVTFMFMFNSFPAGLTYYYLLANLFTIGQNYIFKQFVNEEEILRKIEEKKGKPVKKSRFQQRLEEMTRQQAMQKKSSKKK